MTPLFKRVSNYRDQYLKKREQAEKPKKTKMADHGFDYFDYINGKRKQKKQNLNYLVNKIEKLDEKENPTDFTFKEKLTENSVYSNPTRKLIF